jgi:phage-related protein
MSDVLFFHAHNIAHTPEEIDAAGGDESKLPAKSIWWQGQEYKAWPCQIEGIEVSTSGSSAQPKLSVANLDSSITALCLAYDDLLQAKVTIHDTLASTLMPEIFQAGTHGRPYSGKGEGILHRCQKRRDKRGRGIHTFQSDGPAGTDDSDAQLHSLCTWCIRNKYRTGDGCDYAGTAISTKTITRSAIRRWMNATAR